MTVHMVKCHSKQVDPIGQSASFHKSSCMRFLLLLRLIEALPNFFNNLQTY